MITDSDFDMTSLGRKLECVLYQMEQNFSVEDPICASFPWYLVDYLEFKCDLVLVSLNLVRLQKLLNEREHGAL